MSAASTALVLAPELAFAELDARVSALGWGHDPAVQAFTPATLPGEPELTA